MAGRNQTLKKGQFHAEESKEATGFTREVNRSALNNSILPWNDNSDFKDAERGFVSNDPPPVVKADNGNVVFDINMYTDFIKLDSAAPDTVNPILWRRAKLNTNAGLYKITESVYVVRGYDLANMVIVEGKTGYIVLDALTNIEAATTAMKLVRKSLGEKPVRAVVIGHSHGDHFGGLGGLVDTDSVRRGKIKIIAPEGFEEAAIRESVLAGPAMNRRLIYQFGRNLSVGPKEVVDSGIGKRGPGGTMHLLPPTDFITQTGTKLTIDGIDLVFQVTPDTEAPASMQAYLPQFKTLWTGELAGHTNHNLCPLRGTLIRDASKWAGYINEMLELFPDTEVAVGSHLWPVWGNESVHNFLKKQRDLYKFTHDQTLRLANHGYTGYEIQQMLKLPDSLASEWFNRDYYGTLKFNIHSTYTRYFGWYDGNPVNLDPHPPEETAKRLVCMMGGAKKIVAEAQEVFDTGDYRWVVQLLNYVVFAEPRNMQARNLLADALEQLGYQQESSTWRNAYLVGAKELRAETLPEGRRNILSFEGLEEKDIFDFLAVSLNCDKAAGKSFHIDWIFQDRNSTFAITIENSVLHYKTGNHAGAADTSITLNYSEFIKLLFADASIDELLNSGTIELAGEKRKLNEFLDLFDRFEGNFNIVLP